MFSALFVMFEVVCNMFGTMITDASSHVLVAIYMAMLYGTVW